MKKTVFIVTAICLTLLGGIFVIGFLQHQSKEQASTQPSSSPSVNTTTNTHASTPAPQSTQTSKTYSVGEVAKHNSQNSCWLIINNNVYDVTSFLSQHPGGEATILNYCGKEATKAFDTQDRSRGNGHSPSAQEMLKDYLIGTLTN